PTLLEGLRSEPEAAVEIHGGAVQHAVQADEAVVGAPRVLGRCLGARPLLALPGIRRLGRWCRAGIGRSRRVVLRGVVLRIGVRVRIRIGIPKRVRIPIRVRIPERTEEEAATETAAMETAAMETAAMEAAAMEAPAMEAAAMEAPAMEAPAVCSHCQRRRDQD